MTTDERTAAQDTTTTTHPDWCNTRHKPGASPRRQSHSRRWRTRAKKLRLVAEFYPHGEPAQIYVLLSGVVGDQQREIPTYLYADEARALADVLYEMAVTADRIHAAGCSRDPLLP